METVRRGRDAPVDRGARRHHGVPVQPHVQRVNGAWLSAMPPVIA